jgi:hypothetical protein
MTGLPSRADSKKSLMTSTSKRLRERQSDANEVTKPRRRLDGQPEHRDKKQSRKSRASAATTAPLDIEEGEDMELALEVQAAALAFMKKLGSKSSAKFLEEQREAQGVGSGSDDGDEEEGHKAKVKKNRKSKEELRQESEKNLRYQQSLEAKRIRQVEREQRELEAAESRKKAEKRKGKLFADNDDMWDD